MDISATPETCNFSLEWTCDQTRQSVVCEASANLYFAPLDTRDPWIVARSTDPWFAQRNPWIVQIHT